MQQVIVTVEHPDTVLDVNAFGAGALVRLESSAGGAVPWTWGEVGTAAVVSGTTAYAIWDAAGTAATYYRSRFSDAGGASFSEYSATFLAGSAGPLLTVDELRLHVTTGLADEALQLLLDAAYSAIVDAAGPDGAVSEIIDPGYGDLLMLGREAESITSVVEEYWNTRYTLAADDYELRGSGTTLRRLSTGTHPATRWQGRVDVTYVADSDTAERKRVQLELVKLDLAFNPALRQQTIGTWSEDYADRPYAEQRDEILASLAAGPVIF